MAVLGAIRHVVVLHNNASTHAERSVKLATELKHFFAPKHVRVIDITGYNPAKIQETIEGIRDRLSSKTLLAVGGGDGTLSSVVQAVTTSSKLSKAQQKAVILPLWGGNANDLAVMLNGMVNTISIEKILNEGSVVSIYPLRVILKGPNGDSHMRTAVCYASFGATAQASWAMEQSSHLRGKAGPRNVLTRMAREFIDFWRTVLELDDFRIDRGKGSERTYERIFINGSRIARIPNTAVKLTDKKYLEATAQKKNLHLIRYAVDAFFRHKHGSVTDGTQTFTIKDATMAQIDGEIIGLEADTSVEVSIHKTPFCAWSRKLL